MPNDMTRRGTFGSTEPKVVEMLHLSDRDFIIKLDNGQEAVGTLDTSHTGYLFLRLPYRNVKVTLQQVNEAIQGESI